MNQDLQELKSTQRADVSKRGVVAGYLFRNDDGGTRFEYDRTYLAAGAVPIAFALPLSDKAIDSNNGAVPAFFAGLLPEGHGLSLLRDATKTSLADEFTLLLAIGADVPGDVQIVPAGQRPGELQFLAKVETPERLDFTKLAHTLDLTGIPGVQSKVSATMLTTQLALKHVPYILKLDPADHEHLVVNEAAHLHGALKLGATGCTEQSYCRRNGTVWVAGDPF